MNAEKLPTYKQIDDQNEAGQPVTVLVKRSGEKGISVGTYTGESKRDGKAGLYEVEVDSGTKFVSADQLTDDHQWELAEQLAGTTVRTELGKNAIQSIQVEADAQGVHDNVSKQVLIEAIPEHILNPKVAENPSIDAQDIVSQNEKPKTVAELFYSLQSEVVDTLKRDIERAGTSDPCSAAFAISREIEKMMSIKGLNPELLPYLGDVKKLCSEIGNSGNDTRSRYYRNQGAGLRTVLSRIERIKG